MPTLMQARLIKALPESKTLMEAGTKAGYSPAARSVYRKHTKSHIRELIDVNPEDKKNIKEAFQTILNKAYESGDFSNALRGLEGISRLYGQLIDKSEIKTTKTEELWSSLQDYRNKYKALQPDEHTTNGIQPDNIEPIKP